MTETEMAIGHILASRLEADALILQTEDGNMVVRGEDIFSVAWRDQAGVYLITLRDGSRHRAPSFVADVEVEAALVGLRKSREKETQH